MDLCTVCQNIPFGSLPEPLRWNAFHRLADHSDLLQFIVPEGNDGASSDRPLGHPWQVNFDALAWAATSGCPICSVVQAGVHNWVRHFKHEEQTNASWKEFNKGEDLIPDREQLYVRRRLNGSDGFDVFAWQPKDRRTASLLASVAFVVDATSVLAEKFPLRPLDPDSGSKQSLEIVTSWLRDCETTHELCKPVETFLPSRILDLGVDDGAIRLVEDTHEMSGKYVCLSYRWGSSNTILTTQASIQARKSGVPISSLPRTLRDAVSLTKYLGIRYLWIDSLCILQDERSDWARESARMTRIYSNAHLTFAANHNDDCAEGLFHLRQPRMAKAFTMPGVGVVQAQLLSNREQRSFGSWDFEDEPLSQRGWALQERLLAPRVLMYNTGQMWFECSAGLKGEDGHHDDDRYCNLRELQVALQRQPGGGRLGSAHIWNQILWAYGSRQISHATDKLPAISGLAKLVAGQLQCQYVAGLWSDYLLEGIAWQGLSVDQVPTSRTEYLGPTWSWASYPGVAATGLDDTWNAVATVKSWYVALRDEENPFGAVKDAWIEVHGPVISLNPSAKEVTEHETRLRRAELIPLPRVVSKYSTDEEGSAVTLDDRSEPVRSPSGACDWKVMILGGYPEDERDGHDAMTANAPPSDEANSQSPAFYFGLVIKLHENGGSSKAKRIGWMFMEAQEAMCAIDDEDCWTTLKLV